MKILLVSSTFESITHGPAKFANLMMQINDLYPEHEIRILTPDTKSSALGKVYQMKRNLPPRPFGVFWVFYDNFYYHKAIMSIRKEYDFDVLLFNNAILSWKTATQRSKNFMVAGMINDDEYVRRRISDFQFEKKWWIDISRKPLERRACKALDLVIANSNYLQQMVQQEYRLAPKKLLRLYKAIDLSKIAYKNKRKIEPDQEINILFVKNDFKRGGLKELVSALNLLEDHTFKLTVIGPAMADKHVIDNYFVGKSNVNLDFKGPSSQQEVFKSMAQCDIFCVPALREALGVANIEALAAGIPVVSSDAGGIPEVLDKGAFGWLSKKGDVESLAKAIKACLYTPLNRKAKSLAGRSFVESNFSHEYMLQKMITELKACLKT